MRPPTDGVVHTQATAPTHRPPLESGPKRNFAHSPSREALVCRGRDAVRRAGAQQVVHKPDNKPQNCRSPPTRLEIGGPQTQHQWDFRSKSLDELSTATLQAPELSPSSTRLEFGGPSGAIRMVLSCTVARGCAGVRAVSH